MTGNIIFNSDNAIPNRFFTGSHRRGMNDNPIEKFFAYTVTTIEESVLVYCVNRVQNEFHCHTQFSNNIPKNLHIMLVELIFQSYFKSFAYLP